MSSTRTGVVKLLCPGLRRLSCTWMSEADSWRPCEWKQMHVRLSAWLKGKNGEKQCDAEHMRFHQIVTRCSNESEEMG